MFSRGQRHTVTLNGQELEIRNLEVTYSVGDLPSVSIEGYLPDFGREEEITMTMNQDGADSLALLVETIKAKEKAEMAYRDEECAKACDDGSYGAHNLAKKVVDLELDPRQKLIKKYELKRDDGTLTERGRELLLTLLFDIYEDEVVEALESLEEERKNDSVSGCC